MCFKLVIFILFYYISNLSIICEGKEKFQLTKIVRK